MRFGQIRLLQWLRAFWTWLSEGKIVFMGLLVLAAALLLGMVVWRSEASIRIAGFFLQLIGMIFAVRGLLAVRAHFGQPLLRTLFMQWLRRFPKWRRRIVSGLGAAISNEAAVSARGEVWTPDNPESSLEKRLEAVIANLGRIREEQGKQYKFMQELKTSHEDHKKLVAEKTRMLEESLRTDLEALHTGDILTSLVGLVWLTVGISLSTLAPELARWL